VLQLKENSVTSAKQSEQINRDQILKTLSDAETARVSMAETEKALAEEEDFVDLDNLAAGIQQAQSGTRLSNVVPRSAVGPATWKKIVEMLQSPSSAP
jgi:hypothetical protein